MGDPALETEERKLALHSPATSLGLDQGRKAKVTRAPVGLRMGTEGWDPEGGFRNDIEPRSVETGWLGKVTDLFENPSISS